MRPDADPGARTAGAPGALVDVGDARLARRSPAALRPYNELGVVTAADVHVALRLATLGGDDEPTSTLGAALAVRALRLGHVCVDLARVAGTVTTETDADLSSLPWPDPASWIDALRSSPLVAVGDAGHAGRPLRLVGPRLYLDRYWRQERLVAADLRARAAAGVPDVDVALLRAGLDRLFPAAADRAGLQRLAGAMAVRRRLAVVAGGPGTGKTTTVARIIALLEEQAGAGPPPRVALAAPTGKAAARLEEAVHGEAARLDVSDAVRGRLTGLQASTLHRLLGWRPGSHSRFRHDRDNRLPHDTVVVDETSMVSLSLMAKLVDAVRPDARLILLGDPEQLASVEAGAVLGDIVGPAERGLRIRMATLKDLEAATGSSPPASEPPAGSTVGDGIVVLRHVHRFGGAIAELAGSIQAGESSGAVDRLRDGHDTLRWLETDDGPLVAPTELTPIREAIVAAGAAVVDAARRGEAVDALDRLSDIRVLCAHRQGPHGVGVWTERIEGWLRGAVDGYGTPGPWYLGRPLLVTENDYELQLYNGDSGVVVAGADGTPMAAFERRGAIYRVAPSRLGVVQTLHAMTVHKSQGSQFDAVVVVLPEATSRVLTRELLYTAVTRARRRVTVVGSEASLRAALDRPIARASGLRQRLWGPQDGPDGMLSG